MANVHRIEGAGKSRDLETLTGMRTALSWSDIDRDIATQPTIKLPDRRFLNLWNSYDLSQFRSAEEDWKDWEARKDEATKPRSGVPEPVSLATSRTSSFLFVASSFFVSQSFQSSSADRN